MKTSFIIPDVGFPAKLVSVLVSLLVARAYSEGMEYIEVVESSAKRARLFFGQAARTPGPPSL